MQTCMLNALLSPVLVKCSNGVKNCESVVQDVEKRSPLHAAAYCGEAEITDLLVLYGANVNHKDNQWRTALHRACCNRSEVRPILICLHLIIYQITS